MADQQADPLQEIDGNEQTEQDGEPKRRGRPRSTPKATPDGVATDKPPAKPDPDDTDQTVMAKLQQQLNAANQKLKKEIKDNTKRQTDLNGLNQKLNNALKENTKNQTEITRLNQELTDKHDEIARNHAEINRLNQEVADKNDEIVRYNAEINRLNQELSVSQNTNTKDQAEILGLNQNLKSIQDTNAKNQAEILSLNQKLNAAQTEYTKNQTEITEAKDELDQVKTENQQLLTDVDDLKSELSDEKAEKESVLDKLDKCKPQHDTVSKPKALLINDGSMITLQNHVKSSDSLEWEFTDVDDLNDLANMITCDDNKSDLGSYHIIVVCVGAVDLNNMVGADKCFIILRRCLNILKSLAKVAVFQVPPVKKEETRSEVSGYNHKISKLVDENIQVILNNKMGYVPRSKLTDESDSNTLTDFGADKYAQLIKKELVIPDSKISNIQKKDGDDLDGTTHVLDGTTHVKEIMPVRQNMIGLIIGTGAKTKAGLEKDHSIKMNTGKWVDLRGPQAIPGREIHGALIEGPRSNVNDAKQRILEIVNSAPDRGQTSDTPQSSATGTDDTGINVIPQKPKSRAPPSATPSAKRMKVKKS